MDIDEILAKTYALYDPSVRWLAPPHLTDAAPVAHGWYMLVRNFGQAALMLEKSGMKVEGMPLRRSMIEHGLALTWLAASPEKALTALARKAQYTASKLHDAAKTGTSRQRCSRALLPRSSKPQRRTSS